MSPVLGWPDPGRVVGGAGLVVAAVAVARLTSPANGALFGLAVGAVWLASPAFGFGAAHLGLMLIPNVTALSGLLAVETGLVVSLLAPVAESRYASPALLASAAGFLGLLVLLWIGFGLIGSVWVTVLSTVGLAATVGYVLDRYERVHLGLIGGNSAER